MGDLEAQSSPQSSEDTADDRLDTNNPVHCILIDVYFSDYRKGKEATILEAEAKLASYLAEQEAAVRFDELQLLADSTAPRKDKETWKDWCFRVSGYLEKRLTELARLRKEK